MTLCWNPDGSMCTDMDEMRRRIKEHLAGRYKPELARGRDRIREHDRKRHKEEIAELHAEYARDPRKNDYPNMYTWLKTRPTR